MPYQQNVSGKGIVINIKQVFKTLEFIYTKYKNTRKQNKVAGAI